MAIWTEIECDDYPKFISKILPLVNKGWMFRGQQKAEWGLKHSLERACTRFGVYGKTRIRVETNMIREFKRRLHHYMTNGPAANAYDEWIALMQHYGAPTRFLDFTYSPYVAAYFAFEYAKSNTKTAIWAINFSWFSSKLRCISKDINKTYIDYRKNRETGNKPFADIFMSEPPKKLLLSVTPFRLNERLAYQRSAFLCPGDISSSMEANLSAYKDYKGFKQNVIKYIIKTGSKNENTIQALELLDSMNISRITLFPGLDGFAQSFETRIKSLFILQYGH
jgi:hypothetical protein